MLTRPDHAQGEADHLWPELLPNGRDLLFTITSQIGGLDTAELAVRDLRTGTNKVLLRGGSHAHYVASGHLVFVAAGRSRDPLRCESAGDAGHRVPVLSRLVTTGTGSGDFSITTDGTLVYVDPSGGLAVNARTLVWVDRTGKEESMGAPSRAYQQPRLSPDGKRVAFWSADQDDDIWVWDLRRTVPARLTFDPSQDRFPVWTRDGRRIIFTSNRDGALNLWWQAADGTGRAERLTTSNNSQFPTGITPDGAVVLFNETTPTMGSELRQLAVRGTREVKPLLEMKFDQMNADVSPDGHWLTYDSNHSGSFEVYVRPFPNVDDGEWLISTAGERNRSGRQTARSCSISVPTGCCWRAGRGERRNVERRRARETVRQPPTPSRHLRSQRTTCRPTAIGPDVKVPAIDASTPLGLIVEHWDEELKRLVG